MPANALQNVSSSKEIKKVEEVKPASKVQESELKTEKTKEVKQVTPPAPAAIPEVNKPDEVTQPKVAVTTKTEPTINTDDEQQDLGDKDIFGTQSEPGDKLEDIDGNDGQMEEDDDDGEYPQPEITRDNNRNMENKFNHLPLTDVEAPEADSRVKVENVVFEEDPDSNFFTYLCAVMFLSIVLYILYHNRHKILALFLEGRRGSRRPRERSRGGSKAAYSKLDCNLEEAITSKKSLSGKSMDIIY